MKQGVEQVRTREKCKGEGRCANIMTNSSLKKGITGFKSGVKGYSHGPPGKNNVRETERIGGSEEGGSIQGGRGSRRASSIRERLSLTRAQSLFLSLESQRGPRSRRGQEKDREGRGMGYGENFMERTGKNGGGGGGKRINAAKESHWPQKSTHRHYYEELEISLGFLHRLRSGILS